MSTGHRSTLPQPKQSSAVDSAVVCHPSQPETNRLPGNSIAAIYHQWQDNGIEFTRLVEIVGDEPTSEAGFLCVHSLNHSPILIY